MAASLLLAGCGAGEDAQTQRVYAPADGIRTDAGELSLLNALVVVPAQEPAAAGETHAPGETHAEDTHAEGETHAPGDSPAAGDTGAATSGVLSVTIANRSASADSFTGLQGQGLGEAQVAGATEIPPNGVLRVGTGEGATTVTLNGLTQRAGGFVDRRFSFARGGVFQLKVPVVEATGAYASVTPTSVPTTAPPLTSESPAPSTPAESASPS